MRRHVHHWRNYLIMRDINPIVRFLTISDVIIMGGFGLISPIFAIFIMRSINGGNAAVAGIAIGIFLLSKSFFQMPVANFIDKIKGERDDFWFLFCGSILFSLAPLLYLTVETASGLYMVQLVYGLSAALTAPAWGAIFTRHIDKGHEGVEWGVHEMLYSLGSAITAVLGGILADRVGFAALFIVVSIVSVIGSIFLLAVYHSVDYKKA